MVMPETMIATHVPISADLPAEMCFVLDKDQKRLNPVDCSLRYDDKDQPVLHLNLKRPETGGPFYNLAKIEGTNYAIITFHPVITSHQMSGGEAVCVPQGNLAAAKFYAGTTTDLTGFLLTDDGLFNSCTDAFDRPTIIQMQGSDGRLRDVTIATDGTGKSGIFQISTDPNNAENPSLIIGSSAEGNSFTNIPVEDILTALEYRQQLAGSNNIPLSMEIDSITIPSGIIDTFPLSASELSSNPEHLDAIPLEQIVGPGQASAPSAMQAQKDYEGVVRHIKEAMLELRNKSDYSFSVSSIDFGALKHATNVLHMPTTHPLAQAMLSHIQQVDLSIDQINDQAQTNIQARKLPLRNWFSNLKNKILKLPVEPNPVVLDKKASYTLTDFTPALIKFENDGSLFIVGYSGSEYYQFSIAKEDVPQLSWATFTSGSPDSSRMQEFENIIAISQTDFYISSYIKKRKGLVFAPASALQDQKITREEYVRNIKAECLSGEATVPTALVKTFDQKGNAKYVTLPICFPMKPISILQGPGFNTIYAEVSLSDLSLSLDQVAQLMEIFNNQMPSTIIIQVNTKDIIATTSEKSSNPPPSTVFTTKHMSQFHQHQTRLQSKGNRS